MAAYFTKPEMEKTPFRLQTCGGRGESLARVVPRPLKAEGLKMPPPLLCGMRWSGFFLAMVDWGGGHPPLEVQQILSRGSTVNRMKFHKKREASPRYGRALLRYNCVQFDRIALHTWQDQPTK